jgi:hypothetical protein
VSYRFERPGRSRRALALVAVYLALVLGAAALFDMASWITAVLLAFALPAALDYATGRQAWLTLDDSRLRWRSGRQEGEVALARIETVRFERRLDLAMRVRLVIVGGRRLRLPQDVTPPAAAFRAALEARGQRCEDHPFSLL